MSLHAATGVAIDTLRDVAEQLLDVELAAVIEPPPRETLAERKARRESAVKRLADARVACVALRAQLLRARDMAPEHATKENG